MVLVGFVMWEKSEVVWDGERGLRVLCWLMMGVCGGEIVVFGGLLGFIGSDIVKVELG